MPTFALRASLVVLLLSVGGAALGQPPQSEDERLLPYIKPGQLVDIGGRRINLQCAGAGSPTVILMAGVASWSPGWYKTQPVIAQKVRVCAFDRAGFGFSDPAPQPQVISNVVDDLHAALKDGAIPGPYVLVGHSSGGTEARLYTQRWPKEVVGMVLVDTSPAGQGLTDEEQPGFYHVMEAEGLIGGNLNCAMLAARGPLDPSKPEQKDCFFTLPSDTPAAFRQIFPQFLTAYYFSGKVSLMSSMFTHRYDSVDHLHLGAMPLVVLSAGNTWAASSPAQAQLIQSHEKIWFATHEALAHLSSRGIHRIIKGSGHEIQLDKPQAVIDAVDEVLRELNAGAKS
jgi:pimeloyl-ACP methyl ester carboxylesterase